MAWIESHQALKDHPKTGDLMARMGWDLDTTIGKLHRFWWWCVDYAENGDLRKHNDGVLGAAVGLNGQTAKDFVEAMVAARWLDRKPYFRVHDWWRYTGPFLRAKYKKYPGKWHVIRALYPDEDIDNSSDDVDGNGSRNGSSNRIPTNLTNQTKPTPRRGAADSASEEPDGEVDAMEGITWQITGLGQELSRSDVFQAIGRWFQHTRRRGCEPDSHSWKRKVQDLVKWGPEKTIAAIDHSILNMWKSKNPTSEDRRRPLKSPRASTAAREDN